MRGACVVPNYARSGGTICLPAAPGRRAGCIPELADADGDRQRRRVRRPRLPRRHGRHRPHRRVVPAARRGLEPPGRPGHHAVVLEHRGRLGYRAPAPGPARLGVCAGHHLGQGDRAHRRQRQRQDHPPVPCRLRDLRLLPAAVRGDRARRPDARAAVDAVRVAAVRPPAEQGQRGLRRGQRRDPQVPHPRLAVVLAARGDDRAPGRLRQRARQGIRVALLLTRRADRGHRQGMGLTQAQVAARARADQCLAARAAARRGARQGHHAPGSAARLQPGQPFRGASQPEAARVHAPHPQRRHRARRRGSGSRSAAWPQPLSRPCRRAGSRVSPRSTTTSRRSRRSASTTRFSGRDQEAEDTNA